MDVGLWGDDGKGGRVEEGEFEGGGVEGGGEDDGAVGAGGGLVGGGGVVKDVFVRGFLRDGGYLSENFD